MLNPELRKANEAVWAFNNRNLGVAVYISDEKNIAHAKVNIGSRGSESIATTKNRVRYINQAVILASKINNKRINIYLK